MPTGMDHVADTNHKELVRLSRVYPFPTFVKKADLTEVCTVGIRPVTVYADEPGRQFPCHNKASTWLSAAFFLDKKADFPPNDARRIEDCIERYVAFWGIGDAYDTLRTKNAALCKTAADALPDSSFAFVWKGEDGTKTRHLPLRNAVEVKTAAEWLERYRDRMPFSDRNVIAQKIIEKAARFGAAIGPQVEFLERQAGRGICDPEEVVKMLEKRSYLTDNPALRDRMRHLSVAVEKSPSRALNPYALVKLADTVDKFDRGQRVTYSAEIPRPEDVIFRITFTKAARDLHAVCATTSGNVYEKSAFRNLPLDDVRSVLGDDFADRVRSGLDVDPTKMAEEVATLPRPDAELFDALMSERGLRPAMRKAASARRGLSHQEMRAWAEAYLSV